MGTQITRARKRELKQLNRAAWDGQRDVFKTVGSLDSSLKKNTTVIKRLRTALISDAQAALIKELQTTSLEKYLPEVISAVAEGFLKSKPADIGAVLEVVSALHQRFQRNFTPQLTFQLAKGLASPRPDALKALSPEQREREERERMARQRSLLRISIELWMVGVIRTIHDAVGEADSSGKATTARTSGTAPGKDGGKKKDSDSDDAEPFPLEVLKELLNRDREHTNLPLVVLFVKHFSYDLLGVKVRNTVRKTVEEDGATEGAASSVTDSHSRPGTDDLTKKQANDASEQDETPLVSPELQQRFRNILVRYFNSVADHIKRDHTRLRAQSARNAEAYVKSGEIFEDRQASYEKAMKVQEKLTSNAQVVADALGIDMPELADEKNDEARDSIIRESSSMFAAREDGANGIWEDEDQRRFYEDLIDLKGKVPAVLLEDGKKKKKEGDFKQDNSARPGEEPKIEEKYETVLESEDKKTAGDESGSTVIENKTIGAQVDALLLRLPDLNNRDLIDQAAIDFCFLNSKASRNRLLRVLQEVPRSRQDVLPYYSRLTAILSKYLPDIGKSLVEYLDKEFRGLQRRKEKDLSESRARNARYLAELTKFGVVPEHVIFHCLKVAIEDFHRTNIEIICHILESCGRYLLRNSDTSPRMGQFLETLKKKKDAVHLGHQERILIENAFYYVNPPERPAISQKQRSVMELFVRKLLYLDLTKRNYVKILKQLRKLHWEDESIVSMLKRLFTKVWKVRYNNIHILAIIVGALGRYHQEFAYSVVDEVLEQIEVGLEENNFKHNQRRIALVKYLGELYNYKMVDSPVIFDALYRIITSGHEDGLPKPSVFCAHDPPDDYFRIRLVCALLDVCGGCFDRGSARKKLDFFLTFFQYYIYTKEPGPMDIDFLIQDTFATLRPTWKLHVCLEDAAKAFEEAVAKSYKPLAEEEKGGTGEGEDVEYPDSDSDDGEEHDDVEIRGDEADVDAEASEEDETIADDPRTETPEDDSSEEEITVAKREQQLDPEAEAEFDREFAKMMQESLESRKFDRKPVFDVALPIRKAPSTLTRENTLEGENSEAAAPPGTMMFSLLTKKGNRQQTRAVALPSDSGFAVAMKDKREKEKEEKQKIKELVMSYDRLDDAGSDNDSLDKHAAANGYQFKIDNRARNQPRSRKLSLSDVNWYAKPHREIQHSHHSHQGQRAKELRKRGGAQVPPPPKGYGRRKGSSAPQRCPNVAVNGEGGESDLLN